ncbi:MAG: glycosyltransferase family 2 protein [Myxococcales bacterium]|nr:glycosyltransferase family 2 protein [Myxococcota bacterium]MDW8282852.1 glycosyltransferase family 2 protein [Myxococcales bacterium]
MPSLAAPVVLVIPAYDVAPYVGQVVRGARLHELPVVVVDDGSSDATGDEAAAAGATVLRHPHNRGKGAALQTGFAWALRRGAHAVMTMDADGQHDPAEIPALLAAHAEEPRALVIGVRRIDARWMPMRSRIGNTISTFFLSRFCGRPLTDSQSGFRVYPAELLRRAPLSTRRFETESELLLWACKFDLPLKEVPIRTIYHGYRQGCGLSTPQESADAVPGRDLPRSHFHAFFDTLRVIRLVAGSPWWRAEASIACQQPNMEAT